MLFNEPKLLKQRRILDAIGAINGFSALQRAEIAEIADCVAVADCDARFSALQRAEIAEIQPPPGSLWWSGEYHGPLQRAEIAESN